MSFLFNWIWSSPSSPKPKPKPKSRKPIDFLLNCDSFPEESSEKDSLFNSAWDVSKFKTLKVIFSFGEVDKNKFLESLQWLEQNHLETLKSNICLIPEYGNWRDLLVFGSKYSDNPDIEEHIVQLFANQLKDDLEVLKIIKENTLSKVRGISACAYWAPSERSIYDRENDMVGKINRVLGVSRKTYRKEYLVPLRTYIRENGIDVMPKLVEDFVKISNLEDLVSSSKFENILVPEN